MARRIQARMWYNEAQLYGETTFTQQIGALNVTVQWPVTMSCFEVLSIISKMLDIIYCLVVRE